MKILSTWIVLTFSAAAIISCQSETPTPDPPANPEEIPRWAIEQVIDADQLENLVVSDSAVTFRYLEDSAISVSWTRRQIELDFVDATCALKQAGITGRAYQFTAMIPTIDAYGNSGTAEGIEMDLAADTIDRLNCDKKEAINLPVIADRYFVYPILNK